ncbi:MAG: DUF1553 domain-containing protein [Bryobacterales bacterium]|nr:DUF1553 domain-containing protein [Bryobacterales bacterium]
MTRGILGVTVACARCHDHKYDPFTAEDYYALAGVFASSAYKEYPLVPAAESAAWIARKKQVDEAEKALNTFLDGEAKRLAAGYAPRIADFMMAAAGEPAADLQPDVLKRWQEYLARPEEFHPFLDAWFQGRRTRAEAGAFQRLLLEIVAEKEALDAENKRVVEAASKAAPKPKRTIVLPGGYRSDEDFNPGADIPAKSLERDRFVAWNRTFGEASGPLKFSRELTPRLLEGEALAEYRKLHARVEALKKELPEKYPFLHGMTEFEPWDLPLNIRGNPEELGEVVPRRFPLVLSGGKPVPLNDGSGRLQLANTVAHHPLAARVAVNRIWMHLFGQGLVRTPSNFGRTGDRPAIPELLEYLAAWFAHQGYGVKALIREIVLSEAYQRASQTNAANEAEDPDNRYHWRQNRRRLDAEPLLDAMLAVSGELDLTPGGVSQAFDAKLRRRTVYANLGRFKQDETLSLFDLPAAAVTCEQRVVTNVPLQKLFFLNSDVVERRARALAPRIEQDGIAGAYRLLFQREPNEREAALARRFLDGAGPDKWKLYAQVLLSSNEFAYVD